MLNSYKKLFDFTIKDKPDEYDVMAFKGGTIPLIEYCGWLPNGPARIKIEKRYPDCCFNHKVGLPIMKRGPYKGEPIELYPYERDMILNYEAHNYYALNKCRGAGATEVLSIRHNVFKYITTKLPGRKYLICAGINQNLATVMMNRIKELCDKIPYVYEVTPKTDYPTEIRFKSGGQIHAIPANPAALRSFENVGDIILEESAFWKLLDDVPVLEAAEPQVAKSDGHIGIISTPNRQRGFFWNKVFDPECEPITKYFKHVVNWREVVATKKPILDKAEILKLKELDPTTYEQEFNNQFLLSESRAFGDFDEAEFEAEEI